MQFQRNVPLVEVRATSNVLCVNCSVIVHEFGYLRDTNTDCATNSVSPAIRSRNGTLPVFDRGGETQSTCWLLMKIPFTPVSSNMQVILSSS